MLSDEWLPRYRLLENFKIKWNGNAYDRGDYNSSFALRAVELKMNRHACTIIYSMYRVDALRTPSRLRAGYPTLLQWRGRYDFPRLKTSRVLPHTSVLVIECFLTRSTLFLKCIYTLYTVIFSPAQYQKRY